MLWSLCAVETLLQTCPGVLTGQFMSPHPVSKHTLPPNWQMTTDAGHRICLLCDSPSPGWILIFLFSFFFFIAPLSVWAVAGPGQLCHILSTAGTHFLFPFWINLLTSFTAFTYKNPPTVLPDRCGSNRKDKVRDNGPRADALTSCLFHFLGSFWISSRLYLLGLFVFFLEEYIKRINRLLFYIWHPSTWRCCSWSGSL